jgi:hypothetical protein
LGCLGIIATATASPANDAKQWQNFDSQNDIMADGTVISKITGHRPREIQMEVDRINRAIKGDFKPLIDLGLNTPLRVNIVKDNNYKYCSLNKTQSFSVLKQYFSGREFFYINDFKYAEGSFFINNGDIWFGFYGNQLKIYALNTNIDFNC